MSFFSGIHDALERVLLPETERISNLPTLVVIRSALIVTMPFMLLGSLAVMLNNFPLHAYTAFMRDHFGPNWTLFGTVLQNGTFSIMSLIMLFSLGQHLAERFNAQNPILRANPVITGLISFTSFFCLLHQSDDMLPKRWLGVAGLFVAIVVGIAAARLFLWLFSFRKLHLHLPGGTPDVAIPQAFNALLPGMLTVFAFAVVGTVTQTAYATSIHEAMYHIIRLPFDLMGDNLERSVLYIFSLHLLWFAGIHGANVLDPITHDVYGAAMAANEAAAAAGLPLPHVMTKTFLDTFVFIGGAGTSLCLIGALILFGKTQGSRKLGLISLLPGIFNINEVLLFGLPVVLNPLMLIPFVTTPLLLAAFSYAITLLGLVPGTCANMEWTTPIFLNGYLSTGSLRGPLLQAVNLSLGILVYAPFVILANKINAKQLRISFRELLRRALASADAGRSCTDFQDNAGSLARSLITDLDYDFRHGRGLSLEFQPQVAARDGKVVGSEALLRWSHPAYGSIPAPITVALAEESSLILPLGLWIFERACRVRKTWLDAGIAELTMSVNVSTLQLSEKLPDDLVRILRRYDLPPGLMEMEVTESRALDADTPESRVLARLYDLGFPLAIDDFGMGHSSLKYLKQFPVSAVKIDGFITREVVTNPICRDIVASITRLCRARNIISVAEFVETEEESAVLRAEGCDVFQGYMYSRPLRAEQCLAFIRENLTRDGLARSPNSGGTGTAS